MIATIAGTLLHEMGHYLVARSLGYRAKIHYGSVEYDKTKYDQLFSTLQRDQLWITAGGPLQTIITGTIGFILLLAAKKSRQPNQNFQALHWLLVFLALFWLRQVWNCLFFACKYFLNQKSVRGDEVKLAKYLDLPGWSLVVLTGVIGAIIVYIVVFRLVPRHHRLTLCLAGITGGILGYILWFGFLGPVLIP